MSTRLIRYYPVQRHWYRLLDFVQTTWDRFLYTRTARFLFWFLPKLIRLVVLAAKVLAWAIVVVGGLTFFIFMSFALGGKKR